VQATSAANINYLWYLFQKNSSLLGYDSEWILYITHASEELAAPIFRIVQEEMICTNLKTEAVSFAETVVIYQSARCQSQNIIIIIRSYLIGYSASQQGLYKLHSSLFQLAVGLWSVCILGERATTIFWVTELCPGRWLGYLGNKMSQLHRLEGNRPRCTVKWWSWETWTLYSWLQYQHSRKCDNVDSLYYIYTALHWTPADRKWKVRTCMYEGTRMMVSYQADTTLLPLAKTFYFLSSSFMWVGCSSVSTATLVKWSICLYPSHSYNLIGQKCSSALVLMQTPVCPIHTYPCVYA
jgi:hypothetical protein